MNENLEPVLNGEETSENQDMQIESTTEVRSSEHKSLTNEEIITQLEKLLNQENIPARTDIDNLKYLYYKQRTVGHEALKQKFIAEGGVESNFAEPIDSLEDKLKTLLTQIKEKRAKALENEEKLKEENLQKKLQIIESIKELTESTEDFNKLYKDFKNLQQQWNEIKVVPASKVNELWRSYQIYSEKFYDLIKINNEFRDYDFKKNLELKSAIIDAVDKLREESDIVSAFHQLQNFHQQWREIGPVAKELREELWEKFKTFSTEINKKHQSYFEELKKQEETNLIEKTNICNELKNIDFDSLNSFKTWDNKSKEVIALQAKWKTIGFVPKKYNSQIFEEYRALCDNFFERKAEFFKGQKDEMEANLAKKEVLCERAEALKESTDWKKTTDEMIAIQKEWKMIGTVPRKYSDSIWQQFVAACDYFFEQKNINNSSQKTEEVKNLAKKKELITRIDTLSSADESENGMDALKSLMNEWHNIGHVPFKEKDTVYKEYQEALDKQFERLKLDKSERRLQSFMSNLEDIAKQEKPKGKLYKEREKLIHHFNKVKSDLQTYENNMGFLSISKGSGGLLKEMEHKIQDLKNEMELITRKIETIDTSLKDIN